MKDGAKILKATRTNKLNYWGYGIELTIQATVEDLSRIAEEIVLPDDLILRMKVEGRPPVCFECGEKGHMKVRCPERENREKQESMEQVVHVENEEKTAEEGFTVVERKRRSGRVGPPPGNQKKNKEEAERKDATRRKEDRRFVEKESEKIIGKVCENELQKEEAVLKTSVDLAKEKDSGVQLHEGEIEKNFHSRDREGKSFRNR
ncbi:uncharacterized protein LOC115232245 [Octopus sinensis]|uniref:Uncharacterized protein LOC115232245 n=1 Tax=Octopus sinensis TaxID=2607531 RepID=A0A6P7UAF8_9MOLL|nr:uncharacterized protein LOC115232245 [Octopus sinensis]